MRPGALLALAVATVGCRAVEPATEVVVTVDTAFGVPCTIDSLRIEVAGDGEPVTAELALTDADLPGSLTLVPGGAADFTVTVTGLRDGIPFATARDVAAFDDGAALELRFVLDRDCLAAPCKAVGIGGFAGIPAPTPRRGCGDQAYAVAPTLAQLRDACDMSEAVMGTVLVDADEQEVLSPLDPPIPFPFRFYGEPVTQLWIGSNGYLGFSAAAPGALTANVGPSRSLGEPGFPVPGVAAFWDDLRTGPRGVCLAVSGKAPDRILWVTWKEACFAQGAQACGSAEQGQLTFSVALEETSDRIFAGYHAMVATASNTDRAQGSTATIGLTDAVAKGCAATACSAEGRCPGGEPCGYTEFSSRRIVAPLPTLELDPR